MNTDIFTTVLNDMLHDLRLITVATDYSLTNSDVAYTCPEVARVTFNGDTTIVWFTDNTKTIVKCSNGDKPDRQTAVAYAILKRMFAKSIKEDGEANSTGFCSWLKKIVDNGFDQQLAERTEKERKAKAKAEHARRQKEEHERAVARRVARRAEALRIERLAEEKLAAETAKPTLITETAVTDSRCNCKKETKAKSSCKSACVCESASGYVRPNKKFKDFTTEERRAYWRHHNTLRK